MKINIFVANPLTFFIGLLIFFSCSQKDEPVIDDRTNVIFGILSPDTGLCYERPYITEVFVGKIIPTDINNVFYIQGVNDTVLFNVMICTRKEEIVYYDYISSADVFIEGNSQKVQLHYTQYGIYRDTQKKLRLLADSTYKLTVALKDGTKYTSETTIPKNIRFVHPGYDTLYKATSTIPNDRGDTITVEYESGNDQLYFVLKLDISNAFSFLSYSFERKEVPWIPLTMSLNDTTWADTVIFTMEARSINHDFGNFFIPCGHSMSSEFLDFQNSLSRKTLKERSNIIGENVVGFFGAYNATRKRIFIKIIKD